MKPELPGHLLNEQVPRRWGLRVAVLVLLLLSALIALVFAVAGREPQYQGRKLSSWLGDLDRSKPAAVQDQARHAVREIGVDALPYLGKWIVREEHPDLKQSVASWIWRISNGHWNWLPRSPYKTDKRRLAAEGYEALGTKAAPAVPELVTLLGDEKFRYYAAPALAGIGLPAVGPVSRCLSSSDPAIRKEAAIILGAIGEAPEVTVPALMLKLGQADDACWSEAVRSLGEFGRAATSAIPQLESILLNGEKGQFDAAYALAGMEENGVLSLTRGLLNTNRATRGASTAGIVWHEDLPRLKGLAQSGKYNSFMGRICLFNNRALNMAWRFYASGEAEAIMPVLAASLQSTNPEVQETSRRVTNALAQQPKRKRPMPFDSLAQPNSTAE